MGQLPVPQGGGENDLEDATLALNVESCFSSFFEPQFGQAGTTLELWRLKQDIPVWNPPAETPEE